MLRSDPSDPYAPASSTAKAPRPPTSLAYPGTGGRPVQDPGDEPLPGPAGYPAQAGPQGTGPVNSPLDLPGLIAGDSAYQGVRGALASQFSNALYGYGQLPGGISKPGWMTDAEWANAQSAANNPYGSSEMATLNHNQAAHNIFSQIPGAAGGDTGATMAFQQREDVRAQGQQDTLLNALRQALAGYSQQEGTAYGQAADRIIQQYPGQGAS